MLKRRRSPLTRGSYKNLRAEHFQPTLRVTQTALDNYEQAERETIARERMIVTPDEALHARRLIDFPPPNRILVRD